MENPQAVPKGFLERVTVVIENPRGSYKSFDTEDDPIWSTYPLKGVTYPTDYGSLEGYVGEDGDNLDVFVGTGTLFGYIKVWRLDVPIETKILARVSEEELTKIKEAFQPVLVEAVIQSEEACIQHMQQFAVPAETTA